MPGTPFTWVSMAVVVVCSTVCASAPVKLLVICTVGGVIFGYWLMGILKIANPPTNRITIDMTIAVTGLLRNIFEEFIYSLFFRRTGLDRSAIPQFLYPFGDHRIALLQTRPDDHLVIDLRPQAYLTLNGLVVIGHKNEIFPQLLHYRLVRDQQAAAAPVVFDANIGRDAGFQQTLFIRKDQPGLDRPRLRIDSAIQQVQAAGIRIDIPIGQHDRKKGIR